MEHAEFLGEAGWFEDNVLREWARSDLPRIPTPMPRSQLRREQRSSLFKKLAQAQQSTPSDPAQAAETHSNGVNGVDSEGRRHSEEEEVSPTLAELVKETAVLAPIRLCPPEVLAAIFVYTLYPENNYVHKTKPRPQKDAALLSVCHQWRDIAMGTPQYWSVLSLELPTAVYNKQPSYAIKAIKDRIDRNIDLSKNIPLVVQSGNYVSTEHGKQVGVLISQLSSRCVAFHAIDFCTPFCYATQDPLCDFSQLTTLELSIWRNGTPHLHDRPIKIPNLRSLSASKLGVEILLQLSCPKVTSLRLYQTPCRAPEMQALADRLPLVHTLRLQDVENPRFTSPPITFESLTTLILEGSSWSWCFPILSSSKRVTSLELHGIFFEQAAAISAPKEPFPELTSLTFFFTGNSALTLTWKRKMKSWFSSLLSRSENLQRAMIGIRDAKAEDSSFEQLASFFTALSEPGEKGQIVCPLLWSLTLKKAKFTSDALENFKASRTRPGSLIGECEVVLDDCEIISGTEEVEGGLIVEKEKASNGTANGTSDGKGRSISSSFPDLSRLYLGSGTPPVNGNGNGNSSLKLTPRQSLGDIPRPSLGNRMSFVINPTDRPSSRQSKRDPRTQSTL